MIPRARYKIDSQLRGLPANLVELSQDACAKEFLLEAKTRRSAAKDAVATALRAQGFSLTDANAMVDRGELCFLVQIWVCEGWGLIDRTDDAPKREDMNDKVRWISVDA